MDNLIELIPNCNNTFITGYFWNDYLITGHSGGYVYVWNLKKGIYIHFFNASSQDIQELFVDSVNKQLITITYYDLKFWNLSDWSLARTISNIVTNSDLRLIHKVLISNNIILLNRTTSNILEKMRLEQEQTFKPFIISNNRIIDFKENNQFLVILNEGNLISVWNKNTGKHVKNLILNISNSIHNFKLYKESILIQTEHQLVIYDFITETELWKSIEYKKVNLFFDNEEQLFFYSELTRKTSQTSYFNRILVKEPKIIETNEINFVISLIWKSDENYIVVDDKNNLYQYDFDTNTTKMVSQCYGVLNHQVVYQNLIIIASEKFGIFLADLKTGTLIKRVINEKVDLLEIYEHYLFGSVLSGNKIYVEDLYIWDLVSFKKLKKIKCMKKTTRILLKENDLIFLRENRIIVYNYEDILKSKPNTTIMSFIKYQYNFENVTKIYSACIQKDLLYVGLPETGELGIFDLNLHVIHSRLLAHEPTTLLYFLLVGDLNKIVSYSADNKLKVWNINSMKSECIIELSQDLSCAPLVLDNKIIYSYRSSLYCYNLMKKKQELLNDFTKESISINSITYFEGHLLINTNNRIIKIKL